MDFILGNSLDFNFIWQDKKSKIDRFYKVNKFRRKRNMNLKLCWERQW